MEVRGRVRWEGARNNPDEMVKTTNKVKVTYVQPEAADTTNKAAAGIKVPRREDKAQANVACIGNHKGCFNTYVDGY